VLRFHPQLDRCPRCGAVLKARKTVERHPCTLHIGHFTAHETVLGCGCVKATTSFRSGELAGLVAPGRTFGFDVMVHAGEAVLRRNLTAGDTVAELARMNVTLSESEVRELVARFAVSLGIAHAEAAPRLRAHLGQAGGYVLHLDSTCKGSSAHLMTGLDELSGFVLLNARVPSESEPEVSAFLRTVVQRFGVPLAVSCDMSKGILKAVAEVLPKTVPVFICHFHFLRDLGKDLLAEPYATVRERLRHHGPKAELRRIQRGLREVVQSHSRELGQLVRAAMAPDGKQGPLPPLPHDALLAALVTSLLDSEHRGGGYGFPFDRPHLQFFRQAQIVLMAARSILRSVTMEPPHRKLFTLLAATLEPLCNDSVLVQAALDTEGRAREFDRLRAALRLAETHTHQGLNDDGAELPMAVLRDRVERFCQSIGDNEALMDRKEFKAMLEQIDRQRGKLFADPIQVQTPNGPRTIQPQRTNNILERFFHRIGSQVRKRTGQQPGEAFLDRLLPDFPLVANLDNPRYVDLLPDRCASLTERLSRLDQDTVDSTLARLRSPSTGIARSLRIRLREADAPLRIALFILRAVA
jgi:hypothetical protein